MLHDIPIKVLPEKKTPQLSPEIQQAVLAILDELKEKPGALLPILHKVQDSLGYIPDESFSLIAQKLNLSRAEVHGVVSFYHHFRTEPVGKKMLYICRAESCQAMGANKLIEQVKDYLKIDFHQTTSDNQLTLEPVYCLGNCAHSPSVRIDDKIHGRVCMDKLQKLLEKNND